MTPVVSRGSGDRSGVEGQGPGTAIKEQHGCLAKRQWQTIWVLSMLEIVVVLVGAQHAGDSGGVGGCSACWR